jgi:hypothetical protein
LSAIRAHKDAERTGDYGRVRLRLDDYANAPEGTATKTSGKTLAAILALGLGVLTLTGCGGLGQNIGLLLANIGLDENVAVSNLTKVLLEDELGYQNVEIRTQDNLDATYRNLVALRTKKVSARAVS